MSHQLSLREQFAFEQTTSNTIQLNFLKFQKTKKENKYFFTGFNRHTLSKFLSYKLGYYRILKEDSYIIVKYNNGIVVEAQPFTAKNELLEVLDRLDTETVDFDGSLISINRDAILEKFANVQPQYFTSGSLDILIELKKEFLRDTKDHSFFYFKNGIVKTSSECQELIPYTEIKNKLIWKSWINDHEIQLDQFTDHSMFEKFISNVSGSDKWNQAFISAIGYVLTNSNPPSKSQAIILYDESITDVNNPSGGTGKGIFAKALSYLRQQVVIDGKKFDPNSKFVFQNVAEDTQVVVIDDVKPFMDFKFFHSILSEGLTVEGKNQASWKFSSDKTPKIIISSNSVFSNKGTTNKRRQYILEFSDFYSSKIITGVEEPVKDHHGCMFFQDWDQKEWNRFYNFMLYCSRFYLKNGLIAIKPKNHSDNLLLIQTHEDFYIWVNDQDFKVETTYLRDDYFTPFKQEYFGDSKELSVQKFNKWMKAFAESKAWVYHSSRSNSQSYFVFSGTENSKQDDDECPF